MIDDGHPEPIFKPKKDVYSKGTGELIESGLIPFQAADVLAYLTYLNAKFADKKDWGDKENIRWVLKALEADVMGRPDYFTEKTIQDLRVLIKASSHGPFPEGRENDWVSID